MSSNISDAPKSLMLEAVNTIHPFPARMAPSIVLGRVHTTTSPLTILDPMCGSGTSLVASRMHGHQVIGVDTDPLAVLISTVWANDIDQTAAFQKASAVLHRSQILARKLDREEAYPHRCDAETRSFVEYWFDADSRKQLAALSTSISRVRDDHIRRFLWCAFSRMIITKKVGVSLAMDVSHSRPHRVYDQSPERPFAKFLPCVVTVLKAIPFIYCPSGLPAPQISLGDARELHLRSGSIDMVVTSPPYLNAIDYLRGHKLSLVWMGHEISNLRKIRSANIGAESAPDDRQSPAHIDLVLANMTKKEELRSRDYWMLVRYISDLECTVNEIARVLKPGGLATIVIGDSCIHGTFVRNSEAASELASRAKLKLIESKRRAIPANRRYLPPPTSKGAGDALRARMREEVVLTFRKPRKLAN